MVQATNWAATVTKPFEHVSMENGYQHVCGSRVLIFKVVSPIEQPQITVESQHRHLFIRVVRSYDVNHAGQVSKTVLLNFLKELWRQDMEVPYLQPVKNVIAYTAYVKKMTNELFDETDHVVLEIIKKHPRSSDSAICAIAAGQLGFTKANSYKAKLQLMRDYLHLHSSRTLPSSILHVLEIDS